MADDKQAGGAPPGHVPKGKFKIPKGAQLPQRELGSTGVRVGILGLGGYHLGLAASDAEATRMVHRALDHGMTFLDNCWDYNEGRSEERMGTALRKKGYREKAFLMTKTDGHTAKALLGQLEQSLLRLKTDVIDLVQIHEVIRPNDPEDCFAPGGAIEALLRARENGKLRFIGFTGHKDPRIHLHMIELGRKNGFRFDAVQMPLNVLDAHYRSFEKEVLPVLVKDRTAVLGMKPMGAGLILQSKAATAEECLRYAMSVPGVSVTITGCDGEGVLEQALHLGLEHQPMSDADKSALLARTAGAAKDGRWEHFKTTGQFDGTDQNPHWLREARL